MSKQEIKTENLKTGLTKKLMIHCLELFAKFKNPAVLFREPELKALYGELLQAPDSALQKAQFNIINLKIFRIP